MKNIGLLFGLFLASVIIVGFMALMILKILSEETKGKQTKKLKNQNYQINYQIQNEMPYRKKYLLSKNEWSFYKALKPIADELGLAVLAKIRVADLVEVAVPNKKDYMKYFNKINKKHIDFALAKQDNLQVLLLIELDDSSHKEGNIRDNFIDRLYTKTGYKLLRVQGTGNLKKKITQILVPQTPAQEVKKQVENPYFQM